MELKDLRKNDILEMRNKEKYRVEYAGRFLLLVEIDGKDYIEITNVEYNTEYNTNLTSKNGAEYDIIRVIRDDKIIETNNEKKCKCKKSIEDLINSSFIDDIMEAINDLELKDKECIKQREELNKTYEKIKKTRTKATKNKENKIEEIKDKIKKELDIEIEDIEISNIDDGMAIHISGRGKLSKKQSEELDNFIRKELDL